MFKEKLVNSTNDVAIQGLTDIPLVNGIGTFSPLKIYAKPNTEIFFQVETNLISRFYSEFFNTSNEFSDFNQNGHYIYVFSIFFQECNIGEIPINKFFYF